MADQNSCGGSNSCSGSGGGAGSSGGAANQRQELHACMGLNACKGHDRFGTNECAGMGYCATAIEHSCKTLNSCRGQGGCGLYGSAAEQMLPGANECCWQGTCATPIQAERISTEGPDSSSRANNKCQSVWKLARKLFEERLTKSNRQFGASPYPDGPPTKWLETLGAFDSCGSSGNMYCSFGKVDEEDLCVKPTEVDRKNTCKNRDGNS